MGGDDVSQLHYMSKTGLQIDSKGPKSVNWQVMRLSEKKHDAFWVVNAAFGDSRGQSGGLSCCSGNVSLQVCLIFASLKDWGHRSNWNEMYRLVFVCHFLGGFFCPRWQKPTKMLAANLILCVTGTSWSAWKVRRWRLGEIEVFLLYVKPGLNWEPVKFLAKMLRNWLKYFLHVVRKPCLYYLNDNHTIVSYYSFNGE